MVLIGYYVFLGSVVRHTRTKLPYALLGFHAKLTRQHPKLHLKNFTEIREVKEPNFISQLKHLVKIFKSCIFTAKQSMTVLIARFKNKREATFAAKLIKQYRKTSKVMTGKNLEDLYLGEMIEEGLKEKGTLLKGDFKKYLDKRISDLS